MVTCQILQQIWIGTDLIQDVESAKHRTYSFVASWLGHCLLDAVSPNLTKSERNDAADLAINLPGRVQPESLQVNNLC